MMLDSIHLAFNMKVSRGSQCLLYGFVVAVLLTCFFATSSHIDVLPRVKRSLPVSLVTAPEGAIGYYQPPSRPMAP